MKSHATLDKLAAAGAKLDAFYVQPVCSPTRAAFMTGRYPMRHGLQVGVVRPWAQYGLPLDEQHLGDRLEKRRLQDGIFGKWHLGHFEKAYQPTQRGFDIQYGHYNGALDYFTHERDGGFDWHRNDQVSRDEGYTTHLIGREAAKFVKEHAGKQPFFLYVPFNAVHAPHQVPDEYTRPYERMQGDRKKYAGMLAAMDEAIGQIADAVEAAGAYKNTLFVFSSDNGGPSPGKITSNGHSRRQRHAVRRRSASCCIRDHARSDPCWFHSELSHAYRRSLPDLAEVGGNESRTETTDRRHRCVASLAEGKPLPDRAILLNTTPRNGAVRQGNWKVVRKNGVDDPDDPNNSKVGEETIELFDLQADPYESKNLAKEQADQVAQLLKVLDGFAAQAVPPKSKPKPRNFCRSQGLGRVTLHSIRSHRCQAVVYVICRFHRLATMATSCPPSGDDGYRLPTVWRRWLRGLSHANEDLLTHHPETNQPKYQADTGGSQHGHILFHPIN